MDAVTRKMLSSLYYYFKIFGHGQISFNPAEKRRNSNSQWVFSFSRLGHLYLILSTVIASVDIFLYYEYYFISNNSNSKVIRSVNIVHLISRIGIFLILLRYNIKPKKL